MPRIILCWWLVIAIAAQSIVAKKFMKMFADAGIGIQCPSGNKVYIHPISGDLQLCKQQLGVYNETSCPGGTACERFPILIPGFQDYCCWSENNPETELSSEMGENLPVPMSKRKPGVTVEPIDEEENEKIFPIDEEDDEDLKIEIKNLPGKKKASEEEEEEEDIEWELETTTVKNRKTKSKKVVVITTTVPPMIMTTAKPPSRRPQCNDPEKTVLIDYGNRLRDCYFTQCLRGFKCEFNREIRRFICCGNEIDVPPAGLPTIPEPSPVIKRRPFRPNSRPFGRLNDGEEEEENTIEGEKRGPRNPIIPFMGGGGGVDERGPMMPIGPPKVEQMIGNNIESTVMPTPNRKGKYDEDDDYEDGGDGGCGGNGCTFGRGRNGNQNSGGGGGCEMNCRRGGGNNEGCGMGCRGRGNGNNNRGSQECGNGGCPWNGGNRPRRPRPDDYEENENGCEADLSGGGNNNNNNGQGPPPIPEPKPLCKALKFKKSGNSGGNNNNGNRNNNGPPPRNNGNNGRAIKPPQSSSGPGSNQSRRNGPSSSRSVNGNSNNSNNNNNKSNRYGGGGGGGGGSNRRNSNNGNGNDNCDHENRCGNGGYGGGGGGGDDENNENMRFNSRKNKPPSSSSNNNGDRKVPRSVPFFPSSHSSPNVLFCAEGAEYLDGPTAPQCLPPAIDSCPMTHKKCMYSQRFGHHVCCKLR